MSSASGTALKMAQKLQLVQGPGGAHVDGSQQIGSHHPSVEGAALPPDNLLCPIRNLQNMIRLGIWVVKGQSPPILPALSQWLSKFSCWALGGEPSWWFLTFMQVPPQGIPT